MATFSGTYVVDQNIANGDSFVGNTTFDGCIANFAAGATVLVTGNYDILFDNAGAYINAPGTSGNQITLQSSQGSPAAGDWRGLLFETDSSTGGTMQWLTVRHCHRVQLARAGTYEDCTFDLFSYSGGILESVGVYIQAAFGGSDTFLIERWRMTNFDDAGTDDISIFGLIFALGGATAFTCNDCVIDGLTASGGLGGGIFGLACIGPGPVTTTIFNRCILRNVTVTGATKFTFGINPQLGTATVNSCLVHTFDSDNAAGAPFGLAAIICFATATIWNTTVADIDNSDGVSGGATGVVAVGGSTVNINNSIVRDVDCPNVAYSLVEMVSATMAVNYCFYENISGTPTITNSSTADPLFISEVGNDYHLQKASPGIRFCGVASPTADLDDLQWADTTKPDAGSYRFPIARISEEYNRRRRAA